MRESAFFVLPYQQDYIEEEIHQRPSRADKAPGEKTWSY
jgi:hypothetical protein